MENLKKMAGVKAAGYVTDGMVVGLGTGSTAYYFVEEIGRRIKEEGLKITAVTTSSVTSSQAEGLGIPSLLMKSIGLMLLLMELTRLILTLMVLKVEEEPFLWRRLWQLRQKHISGW